MPANDLFLQSAASLISPLENGFAITPHNTNELAHITRELYVGTGGNIALELKEGDSITLTNVADSMRLPLRVRKVLATGTTATNIVGLY